MKRILKVLAWLTVLTFVLLATVSCSNLFGGVLGDEETTTPEETTPEVTTPEETTQQHVHAWGEWITVQNATCTEKGQQVHTCACGEKETQEIVAFGHTEVVDAAVANTCTTDGLTAGSHCAVCGEVFVAQETVPMAHDWMRLALLKDSTCYTYGEESRSCLVCGVVENAPVAPYAHEFLKNDETQLYTCNLCTGVVFAGSLYIVFEGEYHWFDAYELCEEMGGHLATVTSKYEQEVINNLMSSDLRTLEAYWIGGIRLTDGFHWITEEPFEYTNWKSGQPNFNRENQHFIRVESALLASVEQPGRWNDDDYQYKYGFICEFDFDVAECEHTFTEWEINVEPTCWNDGEQYRICTYCGVEENEALVKVEHNFVFNEDTGIDTCEHCNAAKYNGHIYALFTDRCNWFEAVARCENMGGNLLTITEEEEKEFVATYLLEKLQSGATVWLGMYLVDNQWHWITGEQFEYSNWGTGEPTNTAGAEYTACINYVIHNTDWVDITMANQYAYICEFECEE